MIVDFSPTGPAASQTFVIDNSESKEQISLEFSIFKRSSDANGKEERAPTTDFVFYPEQLTLKAGEKRNLRVTYQGTGDLSQEVAYRLVAEQLPVNTEKPSDTKKGQAQIRFLLQYVASLYVSIPKFQPKLEAESFQVAPRLEDGTRTLVILMKNSGTAHQVLTQFQLVLNNPEKKAEVQIPPEELTALQAENLLAGTAKQFEVKLSPKTSKLVVGGGWKLSMKLRDL